MRGGLRERLLVIQRDTGCLEKCQSSTPQEGVDEQQTLSQISSVFH